MTTPTAIGRAFGILLAAPLAPALGDALGLREMAAEGTCDR